MSAIRKFLFDVDFTDHHDSVKATAADSATDAADEAESESELTEEEVLPTFNEDEMNAARDAGFKAGKEEGIQEAAAAIEQRISETLANIGGQIHTLLDAQQASAEDLRIQAVRMAGALVKKVLPGWSEREGLSEIERLAGDLLERLHSEPRVVFTVNDSLRQPVLERLMSIVENRGIEAAIEVIGDSAIAIGDCRIEWSDGGAERNTAALVGEIDDIIARNAGLPDDDDGPVSVESIEGSPPAVPEETIDPAETAAAPTADAADEDDPAPTVDGTGTQEEAAEEVAEEAAQVGMEEATEEAPAEDNAATIATDDAEPTDDTENGEIFAEAETAETPHMNVEPDDSGADTGFDPTTAENSEDAVAEADAGVAESENQTEDASEPTTAEAEDNPDGDESPSDEDSKPTN